MNAPQRSAEWFEARKGRVTGSVAGAILSRNDAISAGAKKYFTGLPCKMGHVSERHVSTFQCCECLRDRGRAAALGVKRHFVNDYTIFEVARRCSDYAEFTRTKEYSIASKRGLLGQIKLVLGLGKTSKRWTEDACMEEALKYEFRKDFCKHSSGAYDAAMKLGIIDKCCRHMERPLTQADVFYLWGGQRSGAVVAKAGITSSRLGGWRMANVMAKYDGPVDFCFAIFTENARALEKRVLSLGAKYNPGDFSGSSEFRQFTWPQLGEAYKIMIEGD